MFSTPKVGLMFVMVVVLRGAWLTRILQDMSSQFCSSHACRWPQSEESVCLQKRCQITCSLARISRWSLADLNQSWLVMTNLPQSDKPMAGKLNQWICNLPQWTTASMFCRPAESLCPSWQPDSKANHNIETTGCLEAKLNFLQMHKTCRPFLHVWMYPL